MKNIGLSVTPPKTECSDKLCPYHGLLTVRTKTIEGKVVSSKRRRSVTIQRDYVRPIKKYLRSERKRSKTSAYNPPCIAAKEGDIVRIAECRPLSKTISFVVIEKISKGVD